MKQLQEEKEKAKKEDLEGLEATLSRELGLEPGVSTITGGDDDKKEYTKEEVRALLTPLLNDAYEKGRAHGNKYLIKEYEITGKIARPDKWLVLPVQFVPTYIRGYFVSDSRDEKIHPFRQFILVLLILFIIFLLLRCCIATSEQARKRRMAMEQQRARLFEEEQKRQMQKKLLAQRQQQREQQAYLLRKNAENKKKAVRARKVASANAAADEQAHIDAAIAQSALEAVGGNGSRVSGVMYVVQSGTESSQPASAQPLYPDVEAGFSSGTEERSGALRVTARPFVQA